ncbi:DNA primase [Streptomyces sp. NPDC101213]|uniref:DNA primase n=1 Tax=Streptomyces sp. NPDC101213 TaxID=3366130 RepID=UPI00382CE73E
MNRVGLGLAVGAGYLLGRSKKMKLALAVGSMVAGKKLNLTPRGVADLLSQQLKDNPQFKEISEQLRGELRGVGKAASGAMVERQMSALADRLHSRTDRVRDQLEGVVPDARGGKSRDEADEDEDEEYEEPESARDEGEDYDEGDEGAEDRADEGDEAEDEDEDAEGRADEEEPEEEEPPRKKTAAKKAPAKKAPAKKTAAKKAPAKKAPAKKTSARGAASQKTAGSARKTAAKTASRTRRSTGGGE